MQCLGVFVPLWLNFRSGEIRKFSFRPFRANGAMRLNNRASPYSDA